MGVTGWNGDSDLASPDPGREEEGAMQDVVLREEGAVNGGGGGEQLLIAVHSTAA